MQVSLISFSSPSSFCTKLSSLSLPSRRREREIVIFYRPKWPIPWLDPHSFATPGFVDCFSSFSVTPHLYYLGMFTTICSIQIYQIFHSRIGSLAKRLPSIITSPFGNTWRNGLAWTTSGTLPALIQLLPQVVIIPLQSHRLFRRELLVLLPRLSPLHLSR